MHDLWQTIECQNRHALAGETSAGRGAVLISTRSEPGATRNAAPHAEQLSADSQALLREAVRVLRFGALLFIYGAPRELALWGRSAERLATADARLLFKYWIALDLDPDLVREAAGAGENVVYGDASRKEALMAAGLMRASVVIITTSDTQLAEKVLHHTHELRPDLPVVVRTLDERDFDRLSKAGAAEVVPESLEASLMLASHALVLVGVPINRVLKRIRQARSERYRLLRGFFHGLSDRDEDEENQPRLHSIWLTPGARAIGKTLAELDLEGLGCEVSAIRRRGIRAVEPAPETQLVEGDVIVVLGAPEAVSAAEERLLQK